MTDTEIMLSVCTAEELADLYTHAIGPVLALAIGEVQRRAENAEWAGIQ